LSGTTPEAKLKEKIWAFKHD